MTPLEELKKAAVNLLAADTKDNGSGECGLALSAAGDKFTEVCDPQTILALVKIAEAAQNYISAYNSVDAPCYHEAAARQGLRQALSSRCCPNSRVSVRIRKLRCPNFVERRTFVSSP